MRMLTRWAIKLSFAGVLYVAMTTGLKVKLPETILGYKVPEAARQWADSSSQIADFGQQATAGFKGIADAFNK